MTEQQQTIKYKQRVAFSQIDNALICSNEISGTAFKLWCYLFSRPENWTFYWSDILPKMKEGRNAVKNAGKELEDLGYMSKEQKKVFTGRGKEWRWGGMDISLFWDPLTNPNFNSTLESKPSSPLTENGLSGNPSTGIEETGNEIAGSGSTNKKPSNQDLSKKYLSNFLSLPPEEKKEVLKKIWEEKKLKSSYEKYFLFSEKSSWKGVSNLEADIAWWEDGFLEKNPNLKNSSYENDQAKISADNEKLKQDEARRAEIQNSNFAAEVLEKINTCIPNEFLDQPERYLQWFAGVEVFDKIDDVLLLNSPNKTARDWITREFLKHLEQILQTKVAMICKK